MENDFYKILGVARDADTKEIKRAYRQIARDNHPDLNPDNKAAEERFKKASVAFEVLSDPEKRKLFDEFGMDGLREGFNADQARQYGRWQQSAGGGGGRGQSAQSGDFNDLFGHIFGGRSPFDTSDYGGFYSGPMKGQDLEASMSLDFLTAVSGGELEVSVGTKKIKVRVPAGINSGERLKLKGQGGAAPSNAPSGSKPGDLLLSINVEDHPLLRRDGLNLYLDLPVTVEEAVVGEKISVPTPHGEYKVTLPTGVNSGAKLRLKGKGVHRGKKKGDFFVVIQIHSPDLISDEVKAAAEALTAGYSTDIRADIKAGL